MGNDPINEVDVLGLLSLQETAHKAVFNRPAGINSNFTVGLMLCLLWKESSFNAGSSNSSSSAQGIAQILKGTADDIQDRIGPNRFGITADPFYTLTQGERLRDHRSNPDVSIYAAYLYLEDRKRATGSWESAANPYGPNGNKVIECSKCCGIIQFNNDYTISNPEQVWQCLHKIHR